METDGNQKYAHDIQCETCNKQFKNRSGLWKHKKLCFIKKPIVHVDEPNNDYKDLVVKLITENQEIRNMMLKENQEYFYFQLCQFSHFRKRHIVYQDDLLNQHV